MTEGAGQTILKLEGVSRSFGEVRAVRELTLEVRRGEFLTLLGPSGCGKTTALRMVAGFESPDGGRILFNGEDITRVTPQRRGFGMVFQNYALFPHLNVFENVAFGLRAQGATADRVGEGVRRALEVVDLASYSRRAVQELSGGQQQRVALARAVAIEPALLLLDEPLSNLDQSLRIRTRTELRRLIKELGISAIFVTHDQEEAFDLADRIAVMNEGQLLQIDTPQVLYEEPANRFVAGFVGRANTIPVTVRGGEIRLPQGVVWPVPSEMQLSTSRIAPEGEMHLVFRPEELVFTSSDLSGEDSEGTSLVGIVRDNRYQGGSARYTVELPNDAGSSLHQGVDATGVGEQGEQTLIDVAGPVRGPRAGERVLLAPRSGARLHLFHR